MSISGCSRAPKDIVLSKEAQKIAADYKLKFKLVPTDDEDKRDLVITNTGKKTYEGTVLLDFDKEGKENQIYAICVLYHDTINRLQKYSLRFIKSVT